MLVCILTTNGLSFNDRHVQHFITNHDANWQVDRAPAARCARNEANFQVNYVLLRWETGLGQEPQDSEVKDK